MTRSNDIIAVMQDREQPISEIVRQTGYAKRTIQRDLKQLVETGIVVALGSGRGRRYRLAEAPSSFLARPANERPVVGWDENFVNPYVPNQTYYLPRSTRDDLRSVGDAGSTLPVGTHARRILDRLLIDLSWNSSRLEGNTYSLLETEELILRSRQPSGRTATETQMVLNHEAAIEFVVENAPTLNWDPFAVRNLHAVLSENLLMNPDNCGRLRREPVGISGSTYIPVANPHRIEAGFDQMLATYRAIKDPFERSFFLLVHIPYLQPFVDVNKRLSRLAANLPFITENLYPLSFIDTDRDVYLTAVLAVYELRDTRPLAKVFAEAYQRSASKYSIIAQSIGEPDPLRLRYRTQLKEAVAYVIRNNTDALNEIVTKLNLAVPNDDVSDFTRIIYEELAGMHEGNFARYRLTPAEFQSWFESRRSDKQ